MDMLYVVQKKQSAPNFLSSYPIPTICKISSCNVLAFATGVELHEVTNSAWGSHVYVCDINTPWHTFLVTSSDYCITVLEWDITGNSLLIGDSEGNVQIWIRKNFLFSEWIQLYYVQFTGERIIKAVFFHNGRKIVFPPEKRDVIYYMEKFQRVKSTPSVRQFGGVAAEGCLIITATGLLGAFLIPMEQQKSYNGPIQLIPVTESLASTRNYLTTAAVTYGKCSNFIDGNFRIAVANGECRNKLAMTVQAFRVVVKIKENKLTLTSQSLPSFYLYDGAGRDIPEMKITHLYWTATEDADSLIVVAKSPSGCFVEAWSLVDKVTPIHKLLQTNKTEVYKTVCWSNQMHFTHSSSINDICISKVTFEQTYIFLTMADNSIQVLLKDFKRVLNVTPSLNIFDSEHTFKQPRLGIQYLAHDITFLGHMLVVIDSIGQIYAFKMPQVYQEQNSSQNVVSHITSLLEYSIVTGYDAVDVFVSIRPNLLEAIIEKLTENFTRQQSHTQQYYYVNFLTMKTNLYRLLTPGQANDLTNLLMLHSILIAFKSLLRPSDLPSHEKGPVENLAYVLSDLQTDVDKVLLNLDAKDFTVEPLTLQNLQQLIQWVADLALNILARLPQNVGQSKNSGYDISKDIVALNSIRELLVMIRIWGLLNAHCLPVFHRSGENLDILATLFRLLSRLALNPSEPDELLDECCLLPSQVLIPQLQNITSFTTVTSPLLHMNTLPICLSFHVEPECLKFWRDNSPIEGGITNDGMVDSVRNLLLGKKPAIARKCLRCGTYTSEGVEAKTAAMRAWEQRWANNCRCGGFWVLQKN
ncbi:unnamed protein product [Hermetia illucens]|uniref:Mediator of RNA polymerase II transcription subunit 16 n=1 Tax=Hermetia illucens TaxID=343691 RepID=A0A7R8UCV3_HERIL|nr:mediator of RNA polymerase II transcription subunit 16 [Hermetia illucens]CAD7077614.1 unnamed protein product [Hermetia illucens]